MNLRDDINVVDSALCLESERHTAQKETVLQYVRRHSYYEVDCYWLETIREH